MMELDVRPLDLKIAHPFGISRWTRTHTKNVLVRIKSGQIEGIGEGAPNARYDERQEESIAFLRSLDLTIFDTPENPDVIMEYVANRDDTNWAAKAAFDMALHDWVGKQVNQPLFRMWGGSDPSGPLTSFTIGLDSPEKMAEKTRDAATFKILKIKMGTDRDREILEAIRGETDVPLRVDANEGWNDRNEALENIAWLAENEVELVEQPMPAGRHDDVAWLKEQSPIPLIADEDCHRRDDIEPLRGVYDGINIKLDKCGGLMEARVMIEMARDLGMKIMVGCMVASSLSVTAAAHLTLAADYVDLDGHLLLADDPFEGVAVEDGRIVLPELPGLGVRQRTEK